MPERSNGAVSKTVVRATVPRVRIPPSPPSLAEAARLRLTQSAGVSREDELLLFKKKSSSYYVVWKYIRIIHNVLKQKPSKNSMSVPVYSLLPIPGMPALRKCSRAWVLRRRAPPFLVLWAGVREGSPTSTLDVPCPEEVLLVSPHSSSANTNKGVGELSKFRHALRGPWRRPCWCCGLACAKDHQQAHRMCPVQRRPCWCLRNASSANTNKGVVYQIKGRLKGYLKPAF